MAVSNANKNVAICTTTIFPLGGFLEKYRQNVVEFGRDGHVRLYVAGDNKSPAGSADCATSTSRQGLATTFLSIEAQRDYLRRFPMLDGIIPENSDNRRNVAYLMALEEGADVIISVDDDNYPLTGVDFIGEHLHVGREAALPQAAGHAGWYNLCDLLEPNDPHLYPRGFPYALRHRDTARIEGTRSGRIGLNVGLWRNDPDTDAIARLHCQPRVERADGREVALGSGVRCPINTQNTALSRQAMAAYYYVRMGEELRGMRLDRFGDILSGYFVQICADAVGDIIRIGTPVADHIRNTHNLLIDLYQELAGIMIIEDMAALLTSLKLPGESYPAAYRALSREIEEFAEHQTGFIWTPETKAYFRKIAGYMRAWCDAVESLGVPSGVEAAEALVNA